MMVHCSDCKHWDFPRSPDDVIQEYDVRPCWLFSDEDRSPFEINWDGEGTVENMTIAVAPDFFCVHGGK